MSKGMFGSATTVRQNAESAPTGIITVNPRTAAWLTAVSLLAACGPVVTPSTATLPGGINDSQLTPIAKQESTQLLQQAENILGSANCTFPPVELVRMPKATIAPGVIQVELVIPGRTPDIATKIGLINNDGMPLTEAAREDILNTAHALLHLCGPDKSLQPADRTTPLLAYTDVSAGVTTKVVPTTRYINNGLTTEIEMTDGKGNKMNFAGAGNIEELFTHGMLDYFVEKNGQTDALAQLRKLDPIQPGVNLIRNSITSQNDVDTVMNIMKTDDAKGAFDFLFSAMLKKGVAAGINTITTYQQREQEMKFNFFLMLMRVSNVNTPLLPGTYEVDVKDSLSQMFFGNQLKYASLNAAQQQQIDTIFNDMLTKTPVLPTK